MYSVCRLSLSVSAFEVSRLVEEGGGFVATVSGFSGHFGVVWVESEGSGGSFDGVEVVWVFVGGGVWEFSSGFLHSSFFALTAFDL